eukprot:CAMPEP_0178412968 /NCGR_PEP_ID=MMETSP0689_2-20121128/22288_1 /TAXON_ID=160604 /ORGANISM="Amphidinium massartii, Strain CS-259" /LENGTH=188 /DNA_ID=CAMNT_0020034231 /DNA_START=396 /DNA_END=959 /DNA_ORIENTATION=-
MRPTNTLMLFTPRLTPSHFRMKLEVLKITAEHPPSNRPSKAASDVSANAMQMGPATAIQIPMTCCVPKVSPSTCHASAHTMRPFSGNIAAIGPVESGSRVNASDRISVELAMRRPTSTTNKKFCHPPNFGLDPTKEKNIQAPAPHKPATIQRVMMAEIASKLLLPVSLPTAPRRKLLAEKLNIAKIAH